MRRSLGILPDTPPAAPAVADGSKPRQVGATGSGGGDGNFDTNMVIILAALLCALICALGLNSIVRCALRCGRRIAFETPEEAAARLAATGLKKRVLRRIPVEVFALASSDTAMECPICLGEFADGEKIRVLPKCNHRFHVRCIDTWLAAHSSCPTCRNPLLEKATKDGGEGRAEPGSVAVAVADEVR